MRKKSLSVPLESLHSSSNKLSVVSVAARAAGLRGRLPRHGSVRDVCNELCYWSCDKDPFPRGVFHLRRKASGEAILSEKNAFCSVQRILDLQLWLWLCP